MKLLNQSIKFITIPMLIIICLWSVFFYFSIYREIKKSVDEGLDNYKRQIVYQAQTDYGILEKNNFEDGFFSIREIDEKIAKKYKDSYRDTLMYMQDADDKYAELEPARLLSTAFELDGNFYELKIIHSMIEEDDLVKQLFWNILWLILLLFLTIAFINNFTLQRLWMPFYTFLSRLKKYRLGSDDKLPEIKTKTKEFNDLQLAVNTLLKHNNEVFEQQKQFIGNASHELQTPLAIAVNKLELLAEKGNLSDEQAKIIGETVDIIERLIKINKSLLLLSKIENRQFSDNQPVSIGQVAVQIINDLEDIAAFKNVSVTINIKKNIFTEMDVSLANIAISNLIRNAVFHNFENGIVIVDINGNKITVCNTGKDELLDNDNIFTRFGKSYDKTDGTGLGLAIVKAICDYYGHTVSYRYKNNLHCFVLTFRE